MTEKVGALFCTNGMFIIDEIVNKTTGEHLTDIVGGGGTFAVLGSTIAASASANANLPESDSIMKGIKFIVDCGSDFPYESVQSQLDQWGIDVIYRKDTSRQTTRGYNEYGPGDFRQFYYQTPKLQIVSSDFRELIKGPIAVMHLVCSAERVVEIIDGLKVSSPGSPTLKTGYLCKKFVWEPLPSKCTLAEYQDIYDVLHRYVEDGVEIIMSPNAEESFQLLYGIDVIEPSTERCIAELQEKMDEISPFPVIVRCGALGCILFDKKNNEPPKVFPAYHKLTQEKVKDPTGGGNTFLGGFATALVTYNGDLEKACICGNIVSGAVIEQEGLPSLKISQDGQYYWNNQTFQQRWDYYVSSVI